MPFFQINNILHQFEDTTVQKFWFIFECLLAILFGRPNFSFPLKHLFWTICPKNKLTTTSRLQRLWYPFNFLSLFLASLAKILQIHTFVELLQKVTFEFTQSSSAQCKLMFSFKNFKNLFDSKIVNAGRWKTSQYHCSCDEPGRGLNTQLEKLFLGCSVVSVVCRQTPPNPVYRRANFRMKTILATVLVKLLFSFSQFREVSVVILHCTPACEYQKH